MNTILTRTVAILLLLTSFACSDDLEQATFMQNAQALEGDPVIAVPPLEIGVIADITLTGAMADERVVLVRGTEMGDGGCPASLGGACLGVTGSIAMIGRSRASSDGVAEFHWPVPSGAPEGLQFCMQAFIKRGPGGADSVLTNVLCSTTCTGSDCDYCVSDMDSDGICDTDDPCPEDETDSCDDLLLNCSDADDDGIILVEELNACLMVMGAEFFEVEFIEVAYGNTDYLDQICAEMGWDAYTAPYGGDMCDSSAYMYPSYCSQGWLGGACSNGCGNNNYAGFYCGGFYTVTGTCPFDPEDDADDDGLCGDIDPCPHTPENDQDSDGLCGADDPCPLDPENDTDGDGLCGDIDPCPLDPENDIDGDGLCAEVDPCPYILDTDFDEDGLCGEEDPCPMDSLNDFDGDGLCADEDPCPFDPLNDEDSDGECAPICMDVGDDGIILVEELNACLMVMGAEFFEVEFIEVAYGNTDYLDQICAEMGLGSYVEPYGGDLCDSSAYMYPSYCNQGWLGGACSNGCGNDNYAGFICTN